MLFGYTANYNEKVKPTNSELHIADKPRLKITKCLKASNRAALKNFITTNTNNVWV